MLGSSPLSDSRSQLMGRRHSPCFISARTDATSALVECVNLRCHAEHLCSRLTPRLRFLHFDEGTGGRPFARRAFRTTVLVKLKVSGGVGTRTLLLAALKRPTLDKHG